MKKIIHILPILLLVIVTSCNVQYSFTGGSTGDAKTIQINYFENNASLIEPTLSQKFTNELQDLFQRQTNLKLTSSNGDMLIEGEITDYRIIPVSATADQTAAQNRLTISVRVRFYNTLKPEDDFDKTFSFFADFDASKQLVGSTQENAYKIIFDRITQDIFNAAVAKW